MEISLRVCIGDRVRVRRQRWVVVAAQPHDAVHAITLAGIGPNNAGAERRVLVPFDRVEPIDCSTTPRAVSVRRWHHVCRSLMARQGPAGALRAASDARIDLLPYQLEPALALLRGLGSRLLLADEVGLGKTVQAGLALAELRRCGAAERILVLTPAGLREQWAGELIERFALDAAIVDMSDVRRRSALLPIGVNPWSTVPLAIASIDYVKRPEVHPAVLACRWDVVVVDEAHGVTPRSDRHEAVESLCRRAAYVLLLTATPHNGDHRSFLSLCAIGRHDHDRVLVFRRTRKEVMAGARRRVRRLLVRPSVEERRVHDLLARFTRAVRADRGGADRHAWLAMAVLHKRALSSPHALEQSIRRRLAVLATDAPGHEEQQLLLPLDDPTGDLDPADEPPVLRTVLLADTGQERQLLLQLADAARAAIPTETKLRRLARLVARLRKMREPVIVFTEYRDTLLHVAGRLADDCSSDCSILHGGLSRAERRVALDNFLSGRRSILLATDAAGEGLNLQPGCRAVINLELPWNPMRLEQRIGRVDRIGQRRTVHAVHLIARDTAEMRILERLRLRLAQARAEVGAPDPLGPLSPLSPLVESEEDAASRLVVGHFASEPPVADVAPVEPVKDVALTLASLKCEAATELARVNVQRAFAVPNNMVVAADAATRVSIAFVPRRAWRTLLGSRVFVLMHTACEDASGRIVATHLMPLALQLTRPRAPESPGDRECLSGIQALLDAIRKLPLDGMDMSLDVWTADTLRTHRDFWSTRLTRERAIGQVLAGGEADLFQAGLFDRRADREHHAVTDHDKAADEDFLRRLRTLEAAAAVTITRTRAVLVLFPRRRSWS